MVKQITKIIKALILICQNFFCLVHKGVHFLQLLSLVDGSYIIGLLNIRRKTRETGKEHQQVSIKLFFTLWANDNRKYLIAIRIEVDAIKTAKGCSNLILPAASLITKNTLKIDGFISQLLLICILALKRIKGIKHTNCKRAACPKTRTSRKIRFVCKTNLMHIQILHSIPNQRMLNVINATYSLTF